MRSLVPWGWLCWQYPKHPKPWVKQPLLVTRRDWTNCQSFFQIVLRDSGKSSQKGKFKGFLPTSQRSPVIGWSYKEFILINHHTLLRYIPCSIGVFYSRRRYLKIGALRDTSYRSNTKVFKSNMVSLRSKAWFRPALQQVKDQPKEAAIWCSVWTWALTLPVTDRCPLSACLAGPLVVWCALSLLDSTFSGFVLLFRPFCAFVVFVCRC